MVTAALPRPSDLLRITRAASPQFTQPIWFRVISAAEGETSDGWAWLEGYQMCPDGREAVDRRAIFVRLDGLQEEVKICADYVPSTTQRHLQAPPYSRSPDLARGSSVVAKPQ